MRSTTRASETGQGGWRGLICSASNLAASAKHEIDYETFEEAVEKARWTNDCGDGEKAVDRGGQRGAWPVRTPTTRIDRTLT